MEKAFHGRTIATLTATGSRKVQAGFEPLVSGFVRVPFDDLAAVRRVAASNRNVVAVLVELIQGEGGINICSADYLRGSARSAFENKWLLMLDEVQSGTGRTGTWFAFQHSGVTPDVVTLAKGLRQRRAHLAPAWRPAPTAAALQAGQPRLHLRRATRSLRRRDSRRSRSSEDDAPDGERGRDRRVPARGFSQRTCRRANNQEVRNAGLMHRHRARHPVRRSRRAGARSRVLINVTADTVVRLLPALIYTREEAQLVIDKLAPLISAFAARPSGAERASQAA
jgi:acetylornithine aminotransferase